ncbi:hypothetical protein A3A93_04375 [Candidatus Roizmanbacteria bacterium RIFCSPLOWO2_01_FULL_38_12]|uniref:Uncharacterized protein n=1 Tax=Candidatus Roizmanbacteria bacterium RIFCSPLOWO2_01_FULL_38_12 TaxID=1802061 RepID=A0A1F7IXD5_9BACT|nr:MAG: hypothetical protein A2861_01120 [Candidatus Roizmanbacteria bacterium RIFCSPHIGHO2_01_FULL_38_15]OGK35476.1 MAG: hypothetical protein A3F59_00880 [Candidatus Roizmanbacteria bacterium RIFCSPHIGHO2_12_FULL_38_13]OGK48009.1 MAG: hypothetical protein A3A93_04375 [Candidatus Roizmanbacteria bacterium RIFCSPLOWO2_01_FULL_38_12]
MILWILVLILVTLILWSLYNTVKRAPKEISNKIESFFSEKKVELLTTLAVAVGTIFINKFRSFFGKEK